MNKNYWKYIIFSSCGIVAFYIGFLLALWFLVESYLDPSSLFTNVNFFLIALLYISTFISATCNLNKLWGRYLFN